MKQQYNNISLTILLIGIISMLTACSTTRRIDPGEQLYIGTKKIEISPDADGGKIPDGVTDAITDAVDVPPNNYWKLVGWRYPFPLGLWVYNNWPRAEKGFKHWIYEKLVEDPVLISDVRPDLRTHMIKQILADNGYFSGSASFTLTPAKNPRKASVSYNVVPGAPYRLRSIQLPTDSTPVSRMLDTLARQQPYLTPGNRYCTDSLAATRQAIANAMRNRGYYYFRPDYIQYLADTISSPGEVNLRVQLTPDTPHDLIEPYTTGKITVVVNRGTRNPGTPDTIPLKRATLIQMQPAHLRPSVIEQNVRLRPGRLLTARDIDRTQNYLSRLGIFSAINISATPDTVGHEHHRHVLDIRIDATLDKPLEASIDLTASSKSNSYLGPQLTLGLTHRNLFGGGEQLATTLSGSYEWQTGADNHDGIFNSYEASLATTLSIPRLLAPKFIPRRRSDINWTRFSLSADLLNRPHYFKMAQFNLSMAYDWPATRHTTISFTPLKLSYTKLIHTTPEFDTMMDENPAVALSFRSQYVPQMMFTYNYNRTFPSGNRLSYSLTLQEAGNIFWTAYTACGVKGEKNLFGTPFSQFVKGQTQIVWSQRLGSDSHRLVCRALLGAAHAYGNATQVPYAEQFYCGGASSVRAFSVRSLGPGRYHPEDDNTFFDQTGTFRFEANAEYRFPLFGPLHGALFVDAGNVWLLRDDPARPGGTLDASHFLKDLALGTGLGLRFDITMLVVRFDMGVGIHAPYQTTRTGYYNMENFGRSLAFHLAIGYPF